MEKIGGIWEPKIFFKIKFEGATLLAMQKIGGIWKPKFFFKILFEEATYLAGDAENWRDLKTQKKI